MTFFSFDVANYIAERLVLATVARIAMLFGARRCPRNGQACIFCNMEFPCTLWAVD